MRISDWSSDVCSSDLIAVAAAAQARRMGHEPRLAFLSYSNFGNPDRPSARRVRDAVALLDERPVDFEYDGDISADVALASELMKRLYPFCRLCGPATVLILPARWDASRSGKSVYVRVGRRGG